jgi:GntR family transcriptional regulator
MLERRARDILNADSTKPIYVQIADWIESEILNDHLQADQKVYSQYQLADMFTINPATAAKGINLMAAENILYKKRGLGMFVTSEAKDIILNKKKNQTVKHLVQELVYQAKQLHMSNEELFEMIEDASLEVDEQ